MRKVRLPLQFHVGSDIFIIFRCQLALPNILDFQSLSTALKVDLFSHFFLNISINVASGTSEVLVCYLFNFINRVEENQTVVPNHLHILSLLSSFRTPEIHCATFLYCPYFVVQSTRNEKSCFALIITINKEITNNKIYTLHVYSICITRDKSKTSSSAIAERPRCMVG